MLEVVAMFRCDICGAEREVDAHGVIEVGLAHQYESTVTAPEGWRRYRGEDGTELRHACGECVDRSLRMVDRVLSDAPTGKRQNAIDKLFGGEPK